MSAYTKKMIDVVGELGPSIGFTRTSFYNKMTKACRQSTPDELHKMGVGKSGETYMIDPPAFERWVKEFCEKGPAYGIDVIPDDIGQQDLLNSKGVYRMKPVLDILKPTHATEHKIRHRVTKLVKQGKDPRLEIGVFKKNRQICVDMGVFRKFFYELEIDYKGSVAAI